MDKACFAIMSKAFSLFVFDVSTPFMEIQNDLFNHVFI